jgi:hypothetical protein
MKVVRPSRPLETDLTTESLPISQGTYGATHEQPVNMSTPYTINELVHVSLLLTASVLDAGLFPIRGGLFLFIISSVCTTIISRFEQYHLVYNLFPWSDFPQVFFPRPGSEAQVSAFLHFF